MKLKKILKDELFCDGDWVESKDQDAAGDIRLIQLADIGDGEFLDKSNRFMNKPTAEKLRCTYLEKDDILIARMPDPLGRACLFPFKEKQKYVTVVDVAVLRPNESCDKKYLQYSLNSPFIRHEIFRQSTGTTRKRITRKRLGELNIPLPPLKTQQKIAAILDEADRLRQLDKKLLQHYEELSQSLFLEMFGDPVSNPKEWEKTQISQLILKVDKIKKDSNFETIEYVDISSINNKSNKITSTTVYNFKDRPSRAQQIVKKGDVLMSTVRPSLKNIGMVEKDDLVASSGFFVFRVKEKINHQFLFEMLKSESLTNLFIENTSGANYPAIKNSDLKKIELITPQISIQKEFAKKLESLRVQIEQVEGSLSHSQELFNSLLQKAFKGELV